MQLTYQTGEDRILLRLSFHADQGALQEIRAWLTRRLVNNLWPGIIRALETQVKLDQPQAAHASAEIVSLAHQASISQIRAGGNFNTPFESAAGAWPSGEAPLLVHAAQFTIKAGQALRINFAPAQGYGFEVTFAPAMLHGFCTLLQEAVKTAEWGIDLRLPAAAGDESAPRVLNW